MHHHSVVTKINSDYLQLLVTSLKKKKELNYFPDYFHQKDNVLL